MKHNDRLTNRRYYTLSAIGLGIAFLLITLIVMVSHRSSYSYGICF